MVVLPLVLIRIGRSRKSRPSHSGHGSISCSRSLPGFTASFTRVPFGGRRLVRGAALIEAVRRHFRRRPRRIEAKRIAIGAD